MKTRTKNIILLILVSLIWIVAALQLHSAFSDDTTVQNKRRLPAFDRGQLKKEKISYELQLSYNDPFGLNEKPVKQEPVIRRKTATKPKVEQKPAMPVSWGKIIYYGMFSNHSTSKKMGSGSFQGFTTTFNEGDTIMGIKIIRIYPDSIQVKKQDELKYFYK